MPTSLDVLTSFPGSLANIRTMMIDAEYITFRAEQTGAISVEVSATPGAADSLLITIKRVVPAQLPPFAASMVGPTLEITELQHWRPITEGICTATFEVRFSAPITASGALTLTQAAGLTSAHTLAQIKSTVPFVGTKVERVALEQMQLYLGKETEIAQSWANR